MKNVMRIVLLGLLCLSPTIARAQTGGPSTIQGIDPSTSATVNKVADATNNAIRMRLVASDVSSGGTALADNSAFTQSTTSETPIAGLFKAAYTAATDGRATIWRMNSTGSGYVNIDTVGNTTIVTGGVNGLIGIGGAAASGAAKSGNPVQVGGVFNTTQPTVTTGQAVEAQMTARGAHIVAVGAEAFTVQPGNTANTTQWLVKSGPFDGCGTTTYDPAAVKIADATLDVLTATTTCVDTIVLTNISAASATITVQDTQGTPVELLKALTIAPNQTVTLNNLGGLKFTSGIKYQASIANAFNLWVKGRQ